jgi:hypothetical protein
MYFVSGTGLLAEYQVFLVSSVSSEVNLSPPPPPPPLEHKGEHKPAIQRVERPGERGAAIVAVSADGIGGGGRTHLRRQQKTLDLLLYASPMDLYFASGSGLPHDPDRVTKYARMDFLLLSHPLEIVRFIHDSTVQ